MVSNLHERQLALRDSLSRVTDHRLTSKRLESCQSRMIDAVTRAVGSHSAAAAALYGELVDLAVVMEVRRSKVLFSTEVFVLARAFQDDAIEIVLESEINFAGGGLPAVGE